MSEQEKFQKHEWCKSPFSNVSSSFRPILTIKLYTQKFRNLSPDVFEILDSCMYVDDLITSANDTREALKLSRGAKEIMSKASMNLRKWVTNDRNLIKVLEKEIYDIHPILNDSNVTKLKVLGKQWDFQDGC
ncbi:uncharacterized protein NPIL_289151 [Nephila pilipes]|uniref:Uncharacterized protein n=1 Tax=Nephila pilipes TaxID=299642 RepID=A0A8X6TP70_NEPPI|nr:uncharacterized protein NPIL_289151 [Nephila pilipes]